VLFARDKEKGERLGLEFGARSLELEGASFHDFEVVVNATPLGTRGASEDDMPATASQLRGARLVYDLVYNPRRTRFLLEAEKAGCETLSGLEMLIAQAAEQFRLWTGTNAPLEVMRAAATSALER
jgi:shikimate 5-dehydrogenase